MELSCAQGQQDGKLREVYERSFLVGAKQGRYRLLMHHVQPLLFFIQVSFGGDEAIAPVGSDFARAAELFELLANSGVTPCTFADVLLDLGVL